MFVTLLSSLAFASASGGVSVVTDPNVGILVDAHEPGLECNSGVVVTPEAADGGILVRELRDGQVHQDDVRVTDPAVQPHLWAGERVIVYRDARGSTVVPAS